MEDAFTLSCDELWKNIDLELPKDTEKWIDIMTKVQEKREATIKIDEAKRQFLTEVNTDTRAFLKKNVPPLTPRNTYDILDGGKVVENKELYMKRWYQLNKSRITTKMAIYRHVNGGHMITPNTRKCLVCRKCQEFDDMKSELNKEIEDLLNQI